ncbi:MAG: ABC transporter substrate-binding protein [Desulfuromonadales bacterium]
MTRRPVIIACLANVLMVTLLAPQVASGTTIAAIMTSDLPRYREAHRAFVKSMATHGYIPPGTEIILQTPNPDQLSWSNTIRKFNAYRPDMIVAYGAPAAMTAFREADGIPVVSIDVFAAEQPSKGMCGVSSRVPMVTLLRNLQGIRPFRRVGVLFNPREIGSQRQLDDIRKYSAPLGMTVTEGVVNSIATLDTVLGKMLDAVDVIVATEGSIVSQQFERIVARARGKNIPVVSTMPDAGEKGALLSLEINPQEQGYLAAEMATRVLEGAKTEHLSLLAPHRIDLVVNMRMAREIGISVPFAVLSAATRVIK